MEPNSYVESYKKILAIYKIEKKFMFFGIVVQNHYKLKKNQSINHHV